MEFNIVPEDDIVILRLNGDLDAGASTIKSCRRHRTKCRRPGIQLKKTPDTKIEFYRVL